MQANDTAFCEARRVSFESLRRLTNAVSPETRTRLAHEHDAFHRARKLSSADDLLLLVLFYSAANVSLRLVSWFAKVALGINICDQSLGERFKNCGAWLRSLVAAQLAQRIRLPRASASLLRIIDGSVVCRNGAKGTEWRVHVILDPCANDMIGVELTDEHGAEGLNQGILDSNTLVIGDSNYGRYRELATAMSLGVNLLARTHLQSQALRDQLGKVVSSLEWANASDRGELDHDVQVGRGNDAPLPARLIMRPLPTEAAARARQKVHKLASKKGRKADPTALRLAGYLCLLTTLPREKLSVSAACALYRVRWQVECFFKRAKSLVDLGKIRGKSDLVETQVWARLLLMCDEQACRPAEADELACLGAATARPPTPWRWTQCALIRILGPWYLLAALGMNLQGPARMDGLLRERPRKRGARDLVETHGLNALFAPEVQQGTQ